MPQQPKKNDNLFEGAYLNLTGKIFLASLAAWAVGKFVNTKLRGYPDEIQAVVNALMSSKVFQNELRKPGATVDSVMEKLRVKQMSASEFKRVLGVDWPL